MQIWYLQDGEPIPGIDGETRPWRGTLLADALVERGHRVTWWTATFDHVGKRFRRNFSSTVLLRPGLRVRMLHGPGYRSSTGLRRLRHQRAIARAFADEAATTPPPDLLIAGMPTLELAEQAVRFGRLRGLPVLIDVRDAWPDQYLTLAPSGLRPLLRLALQSEFTRLQRLLSAADGISAVSQTYLDWALAAAGRSARPGDGVFPLGFSAPPRDTRRLNDAWQLLAQRHQLADDQLIAVFAGGLNSSIDLSGLFAAMPRLTAAYPQLRVVIAGDGDRLAAWQRHARHLPQVIFTGRLERAAVAALLAHAAVGLAPYRSSTLISLPNKPFEYFAAGLPVLNSLPGELARLLDEQDLGRSYRADDAASCVDAFGQLLGDADLRAAIAARAVRLAQSDYRAEQIVQRLADHAEQLVLTRRRTVERKPSPALDTTRRIVS